MSPALGTTFALAMACGLLLACPPTRAEPVAQSSRRTIPVDALTPQQTEALHRVSILVLQAMATERAVVTREAAEERARLAPARAALEELERNLQEEVMHPRTLPDGSHGKRDIPTIHFEPSPLLDTTQDSFSLDSSGNAQARSASALSQRAPHIFNWSELTGRVNGRNIAVMESLARKQSEVRSRIEAMRRTQRLARIATEPEVVDHLIERTLVGLDALPDEPAARLVEVRRLRRALEVPDPPPYVPSSPSLRREPTSGHK